MRLRPDYPVHTERLRLRPLAIDDVEDLVSYRSLERVCRFVPFEPMDGDAVAERIAGAWAPQEISAEGESLTLGVELAATSRVIGDVVLFFHSAEHRGGELGWVFHPGGSGNGYATEAAHAVLHLAFDELALHRVVARVDSRNEASMRLAERLRMRREARLVENEWFKGGWSEEVDFAILEGEWADHHVAGSYPCRRTPGRAASTGPANVPLS